MLSTGADSSSVDMQLRKAFQDLQLKMTDTRQRLKQGDMAIEGQKTVIRVAELTKQELNQLPKSEDCNTYHAVGRMFVMKTVAESIAVQQTKIEQAQEKIAAIQRSREYLEKNLKEAEDNLREMIHARQGR